MADLTSEPLATFIVPCYKLGHLLPECIGSILAQTYRNFEILIMDDCSPDETEQVGRSFTDKRISYTRNASNLGHLRNYNKGIGLAKGKYIWLISADDRLRSEQILERYVALMEMHPEVGYVFCPGHGIDDSQDRGLLKWSAYGPEDVILKGHVLLMALLKRNFILAPSAMVREECYRRISLFPEDMPYGGDWFLWCVFALYYDVAYFAEPMVDYRVHDLSMSTTLSKENIQACVEDDIALPWRIKHQADLIGASLVAERCQEAIIEEYVRNLTSKTVRGVATRLSTQDFENSLRRFGTDPHQTRSVRLNAYKRAGEYLYWDGNYVDSASMYRGALSAHFVQPTLWAKLGLLAMGGFGNSIRRMVARLKDLMPTNKK